MTLEMQRRGRRTSAFVVAHPLSSRNFALLSLPPHSARHPAMSDAQDLTAADDVDQQQQREDTHAQTQSQSLSQEQDQG